MTIVSYPPSLEKRTYCTPHIASPQPRHLCGPMGIAELRLPSAWLKISSNSARSKKSAAAYACLRCCTDNPGLP